MDWLQDIENVVNPNTVAQANLETIEKGLFRPTRPNEVAGVLTVVIGPPTAGTFVLYDRWVDANGAQWECTAAGTPGTWRQITPAMKAADPVAGTYPAGYLIARTDQQQRQRVCTVAGTPGTWAWAGRGLAAVADAAGGATVDAEARTAINTLLARMRTAGEILP